MTKKEIAQLNSDKCHIEVTTLPNGHPSAGSPRYLVSFSLAPTEMFAMQVLLEGGESSVDTDLKAFLDNAANRAGVTLPYMRPSGHALLPHQAEQGTEQ
jgi:hypothetical protein